ncbi:MAG: hypothetical protein HYW62_03785 [Candidatus Levybacteria bacterium]|nr:hypothetical protein [Candidatus Levybacteria bacterium]
MPAILEILARRFKGNIPGMRGVPESSVPKAVVPDETNPLPSDVLGEAIAELKANPFSPEALTNYWRVKLQVDGKRVGLEISVPDCNWTEEEIRLPMKDTGGNAVPSMLVYIPGELMGQEGLAKLKQMYLSPSIQNSSVQKGANVQDRSDTNTKGVWVKVEATLDAPNLGTTRRDLKKHSIRQGYVPQRENTYILASEASRVLRGERFDVNTWSWLGSRLICYGFYVSYRLSLDGSFLGSTRSLPPKSPRYIGGRFEEMKKSPPSSTLEAV